MVLTEIKSLSLPPDYKPKTTTDNEENPIYDVIGLVMSWNASAIYLSGR